MDAIKPPLLWIGGRCYRQNILRHNDNESSVNNLQGTGSYEYEDDVYDIDENLVQAVGDRFVSKMMIPNALCGVIVGKGGSTKKQIESETRTKINVPNRGEEIETKIMGHCKSDVISARNRIDILCASARGKTKPTHFISIPLLSTEIKERFAEFRSDVLQNFSEERGIQASLFQDPDKLHLTIGTLVLLNDDERQRAAKVLIECKDKVIRPILGGTNLIIEMTGVEYMNDDPCEVNVLYGKVSCKNGSSDTLQRLADLFVEEFVKVGLMAKQYSGVKLHATLMNTSFLREQQTHQNSGRPTAKMTFNSTKIIDNFKDFRFGECDVPSIHLSQLHSKGVNGYYKDTATIPVKLK